MPPRGGKADLSDADLKSVVIFMLEESGQSVAADDSGTVSPGVVAAKPATAAIPAALSNGKEVYETACASCHGSGLMDAPKLGDSADWGARLAQGFDTLLSNAANGKGSMPPRGGKADLSDAGLKSVVVYMLQESGQSVAAEDIGSGAELAEVVAAEQETEAVAEEPLPEETAASSEDTAAVEVAMIAEPEVPVAPVVIDHSRGEEIYKNACSSCHDEGVDDAPGMDDVVTWVQLMAAGNETLYASTINGKGAMPPKGGQKNLTETDIKEAVDYIISKVISAM